MISFKAATRIAAFSVLASYLTACEPAEEQAAPDPGPRPVKVAEVGYKEGAEEYPYAGSVLAAKEAELSFRVNGQIIELPVLAMTEVKKGDVIARLDPRDFKSSVEQVEAQLKAQRAELDSMTAGSRREDRAALQAAVEAANAEVAASRANAKKILTDYRHGLITKEQLDGEMANLKAAEARLASSKQDLAKGEAGSRYEDVEGQLATIANLEASLQEARDAETDTVLVAPFDGIIAERRVDNFANVQANQTIVIIQDHGMLEMKFDMPGLDVARLAPRGKALAFEAELDAVPNRRFPAEIVEYTSRANPQTQTFEARVAIERPTDLLILPGMSGRVIVIDTLDEGEALSIPATAIGATPEGDSIVWVVGDDNLVSSRKVELGKVSDLTIKVQGLKKGETVVTAGLSSMREGLEIRPISEIGN